MPRRFSFGAPGRFGPGDSWFRVGTVDVTTTLLVIGLSVVSMIVYAIDKVALLNLALLPDDVRSGEVWRVVSWPFYNEPDIWTALTLYIFWILGSEVERLLGRDRFAVLIGTITIIGGVAATVLDLGVAGIRPVELAVIVIFAIEFPNAQFFFGIPARALAAVIVALDVLSYTGDRAWEALWFTAITIVTGVLMMRAFGYAHDLPWLPRIPLPGTNRPGGGRSQAKRSRGGRRSSSSHLRVAPPPPSPSTTLPDDIDRILDKIAASGIQSLTAEERAILDQASRRMRDERGK